MEYNTWTKSNGCGQLVSNICSWKVLICCNFDTDYSTYFYSEINAELLNALTILSERVVSNPKVSILSSYSS
jgi:hypothetical protein